MRHLKALLALTPLALAGCVNNPLGSSTPGPMPVLGYAAVQETAGSTVLFSPASPSPAVGIFGGSTTVSCGGNSRVYAGPSSGVNPNGIYGLGSTPLILGPSTWLCPTGNCKDVPSYRGVGGVNGDYASDFFVRYSGYKGPSASNDYTSMTMNFGGTVERDLSAYRGIVFWARGHGNFAVNLVARNPNDGPPAIVPPNTYPYSGWNFFLRRFGTELNGDEQWKEVVVYFEDMVQEYGLAADLPTVQKRAIGLQFDQQQPYTPNFQLDLDYVRLF